MTDRICIASNGTDQAHLSAQDVASCDHMGDMGCNGGIPSSGCAGIEPAACKLLC